MSSPRSAWFSQPRAGLTALVLAVLLAAAGPLFEGGPAKYIHVRWRPGVSGDARRELERRFSLRERRHEGRSFGYDLLDDSRANVRALIEHPSVEDTHHLDRESFTVASTADTGESRTGLAWRWGFERQLPWVTWLAGALFAVGAAATVGARRLVQAGSRTGAAAGQVTSRSVSALQLRRVTTVRWGNRLVQVVRRIPHYYRLPPLPPPHPWPGSDRSIILALAVVLQAVYLVAIILGFECDAAAFYGSAKAMAAGIGGISPVRPPLFPIFLVLTGTVWPGTFVIVVLAQAAMGVAIPLLVYGVLYGLGRWPARVGALVVMLSTTPFVSAKLILAEQLYAFLTLLTVFFLARYDDHRDPRSIYGFVLAGLAAMLTRWEAEFIFAFGLCAIVILAARHRRQLRHAIAAIALVLIVLAGYSTVRAWSLGDPQLIGTLQSGTGLQLFQRVYGMDPRDSKYSLSHYLGTMSAHESLAEETQFVNPANGLASRRLRDLVADFARQHPDSYRSAKDSLKNMYREADASPEGPYEELYGRFDGSPDALADNIFRARINFRTAQYPFYVAGAAQQMLGLVAGERLLFAAGLETIRTHPGLMVAMVADGFTLTGLSIDGISAVLRDPLHAQNWRAMFPLWGVAGYTRVDFDIAACASNSLSPRMMAEYRFDRRWATSAFADRAIALGGFGRNLVRAACGALLLFGWWLLFIAPRRGLYLPVLVSLCCLIATVGIGVGGGNSKYDIGFMPLFVIIAVSIAAEAARRVRPWSALLLKRHIAMKPAGNSMIGDGMRRWSVWGKIGCTT